MPIRFRIKNDHETALGKAVRNRVSDLKFQTLTEEQIQAKSVQFLQDVNKGLLPNFRAGVVLFSNQQRTFAKDAKFFVNWHNLAATELSKMNRRAIKQAKGRLDDIAKEISALSSDVTELEIAKRQHYDSVVHNQFARHKDWPLEYADPRWAVDYKTNITFLEEDLVHILPNSGITLPINNQTHIPMVDVQLVGEKTDFGDSAAPILSSDPRSLMVGDIFRHVIVRREHDSTSRVFGYTPSYCTLLFELAGKQQFNHIRIVPAAHTPLNIETVSYLNDNSDLVSLQFETIELYDGIHILCEPVRTRYLEIQLRQFTPLTKDFVTIENLTTKEFSKFVNGLGWSTPIEIASESIEGRVYDFSVSSVDVFLNNYNSSGLFRSKDLKLDGVRSLSMRTGIDYITVSDGSTEYTKNINPLAYQSLVENYVGLKIVDDHKHVLVNELIPLPDSLTEQKEYLAPFGSEAKVKLFPDILFDLDSVIIDHVTKIASRLIRIVTTEPLNLKVDDEFLIYGPPNSVLSGIWTVDSVINDHVIQVRVTTPAADYVIETEDLPHHYIFSYPLDGSDVRQTPITLMQDDKELSIGNDFLYSLDGGSTWLNSFRPYPGTVLAINSAESGKFMIQLARPNLGSAYTINYKILPTQSLGHTGLVKLSNNTVVVDPKLKSGSATINAVLVIRSGTASPNITPVVTHYNLKVRLYNGS